MTFFEMKPYLKPSHYLNLAAATRRKASHDVRLSAEVVDRVSHHVRRSPEVVDRVSHHVGRSPEAVGRVSHHVRRSPESVDRVSHHVRRSAESVDRVSHYVGRSPEAVGKSSYIVARLPSPDGRVKTLWDELPSPDGKAPHRRCDVLSPRSADTFLTRCKRRLIDMTHLYVTPFLTWACSPNISVGSIYPRLRCAYRWAEPSLRVRRSQLICPFGAKHYVQPSAVTARSVATKQSMISPRFARAADSIILY